MHGPRDRHFTIVHTADGGLVVYLKRNCLTPRTELKSWLTPKPKHEVCISDLGRNCNLLSYVDIVRIFDNFSIRFINPRPL